MTTKLQMTRRWIPALIMMLGLFIHLPGANAQSRGSTTGRQTNKESTEKKVDTSSQNKPAPQESSRNSSRQPATQPANGNSSPSTRQPVGQSSTGNSTSTSRQPAAPATRGSASSGTVQERGRSSAGNSSSTSRQPVSPATRSSSSSESPRDEGRATASRGNAGNSSSSSSRTRSESGSDANNSQQQNTRGSGAATGSREQSGSRSGSAGRTTTTNDRTRVVNDDHQSAPGRGAVNDRGSAQSGNARADVRNTGVRRDATSVRISPAPNYGWRNTRDDLAYKNRNWHYKSNRVYANPVYYHRPNVQINVVWPWQNRYRRAWRPSYRYTQVVYVESGWGRHHRRAKVDIRTNYHHEVRYADHQKAVVDIYLDEIEVYEDGYFLGKVRRFPNNLEHIEATIYRNGKVVYDRDVFIVGDPHVGFEMISTQYYDGYVLDRYNRGDRMDVGRLNFSRQRVDSRRYSQLFDPYNYRGYAPISVLPDDEQLLDYGYDAISYHQYNDDYDPYYGGSYDDDYYDYDNNGHYSVYNAPRGTTNGRAQLSIEGYVAHAQPLTLNRTQEYKTKLGVAVKIQREATLERLK